MGNAERLLKLFEALPDEDQGEIIHLAEFLARKAGNDGGMTDDDRAWMDADLSNLAAWEPFDWGPDGPPKGQPVTWDEARGAFVIEATADARWMRKHCRSSDRA